MVSFPNADTHDGLTVNSGPLFVAVTVSTDVTEVEHRHKVAPVFFGAIFLLMRGDTLAITKENRHVFGYLCGNFERKALALTWQVIACEPITNHGHNVPPSDYRQDALNRSACWITSYNALILLFSVFIDTL